MRFASLEVIFQAKQVRFSSQTPDWSRCNNGLWVWILTDFSPVTAFEQQNIVADSFEFDVFFTVNLIAHSRLANLSVIRLHGVGRGLCIYMEYAHLRGQKGEEDLDQLRPSSVST